MTRRPAIPKWPTEAAMFAAFVEQARAHGFRVYPESCGHDLVMVAPDPLPPGDHWLDWGALQPGDVIAVEGKLTPNLTVLWQAMPPHRKGPTPTEWARTNMPQRSAHWYVTLVPRATYEYRRIAYALGCTVAEFPAPHPEGHWRRNHRRFNPLGEYPGHLRITPEAPLDLPDVEVDLTPGQPGPRAVTRWKLAAVRLCLLGRDGRVLTAADVGGLARSFVTHGWMERIDGRGKTARYRLLEREDRPDRVYPEIVAALEAADRGAA